MGIFVNLIRDYHFEQNFFIYKFALNDYIIGFNTNKIPYKCKNIMGKSKINSVIWFSKHFLKWHNI